MDTDAKSVGTQRYGHLVSEEKWLLMSDKVS